MLSVAADSDVMELQPVPPDMLPPTALPVLAQQIPQALRERRQWVLWRYRYKPDVSKPWTKVPYMPNGRNASHSDSATWVTFDEALQAYGQGSFDGIGYVLSGSDGFCGIDLDNCRDAVTGAITADAQRVIDRFGSYTEISPSGAGLHIFIEGKLNGGGKKESRLRVEVYDRVRYFCVTGRHLEGTPAEPQPRQEQLDSFLSQVWGNNGSGRGADKCSVPSIVGEPAELTAFEFQVLAKAFANEKTGEKFRSLYYGRHDEGKSQSEADLALCSYLSFWFNRDPAAIDRIFRSSKLMRLKWDEVHYGDGRTYGQTTIQKAIESTKEGYTGESNSAEPVEGWSEPFDFFGDPALTGRPEWPENACPKAIDDFARDEAERIGVEVPMVAIPAIAMAAIATSDRFKIQPKEKDDSWTEEPRLWLGIIAEPGMKKTPAIKAAKAPIVKIAYEWHLAHKEALAEYKFQYEYWKNNLGECAEPVKPVERRLYVDDCTTEALRRIAEDNHDGFGLIKDELSGWLTSFDNYRNQSKGGSKDRADFCELYQGGPKAFDRAERGYAYVPHWGASIIGGIQPGPVRKLMGHCLDDGLVARFLVAYCERQGEGSDREPNRVAVGAYHNTIRKLTELTPRNNAEAERFLFAPETQVYRAVIRRVQENVRLLPDTSDGLKAHLNKLEGVFCRIALVYHMVEAAAAGEYPERWISVETAKMAATLVVEYLLPNSCRFYRELVDDGSHIAHPRWIAGYILSEKLDIITKRDIQRNYRSLKDDPKAIAPTMNSLVLSGWVEERERKKNGEIAAWVVNPAVHMKFAKRAELERERRAGERAKIQKAVEALKGGRE